MKHKELEVYLSKLEKALGIIAVSEKAEIITEIKSHVLDAIDNDENATISSILASLGEPEHVASKYILERGLTPQRPPKHPIIKWLVIGFLGTSILIFLFIIIAAWKFTPIVKVDEAKGRVQILGGLIDINKDSDKIKFGRVKNHKSLTDQFEGSYDLTNIKTDTIAFDFLNTNSEFRFNDENKIEYDCKLSGHADIKSNQEIYFNFKNAAVSKCEFKIPRDYKVKINSTNGSFKFKKIINHLDLNVTNGHIKYTPDKNIEYSYDLSVVNGKINSFMKSRHKNAYKIKMSIINGTISN